MSKGRIVACKSFHPIKSLLVGVTIDQHIARPNVVIQSQLCYNK